MIYLILYTWCLPQTILALIVRLFIKIKSKEKANNVIIYKVEWSFGSLSLSNMIYLCNSHWNNNEIVKHETGHFKQSLILGWFFLLVIGFPSLMWAWWLHDLYNSIRVKRGLDEVSYYSLYTEKWANKLGGANLT